jgi:hypothetical protein
VSEHLRRTFCTRYDFGDFLADAANTLVDAVFGVFNVLAAGLLFVILLLTFPIWMPMYLYRRRNTRD